MTALEVRFSLSFPDLVLLILRAPSLPLKLHSNYDVCSFLRQAYVNSPDEEDLYDYLYEDGGVEKLLRQEEEDDIRKAVQERYHICRYKPSNTGIYLG